MKFLIVLSTIFAVGFSESEHKAIVVLSGEPEVRGEILLTQTPEGLLLEGHIRGLKPGKHGFHVHQLGDLRKGCLSTGGHYNPQNHTHGAPNDKIRHAGDLGNIVADEKGDAHIHVLDKEISLEGDRNILGRAVVVHTGEDDLGKGGQKDSLTTGNAGGRTACGIIGIL